MKTALLIVTIPTHFSEFLRLADALRAEGTYQPVFCLAYTHQNFYHRFHLHVMNKYIEQCQQKDYSIINLDDLDSKASLIKFIEQNKLTRNFNKLLVLRSRTNSDLVTQKTNSEETLKNVDMPKTSSPFGLMFNLMAVMATLLRNYRYFFYFSYYRQYIRELVSSNNIDIIVLPEDNIEYGTSLWVSVGNSLDIPSVIVPYTIANVEESVQPIRSLPSHKIDWKHPLNWIASKLFSQWEITHRGVELIRFPGFKVFMTEYHRASTPNPWLFYSSFAKAITVESQAMKDYHVASGVPEDQLIITGAAYDDTLAEYLHDKTHFRQDLYDELNLDPDKPFMLVALPPVFDPHSRENVDDFHTFKEIVDFWLSTCASIEAWNVVVSLHPMLPAQEWVSHIETHGVKVSTHSISKLVPLSDIYIACASATIRLAIACGIPIINYDVFRFRYQDYENIDGVFIIEEKQDFIDKIYDLTSSDDSLKQARLSIRPFAKKWGMLDGKSTKRIVDTFDTLTYRI